MKIYLGKTRLCTFIDSFLYFLPVKTYNYKIKMYYCQKTGLLEQAQKQFPKRVYRSKIYIRKHSKHHNNN